MQVPKVLFGSDLAKEPVNRSALITFTEMLRLALLTTMLALLITPSAEAFDRPLKVAFSICGNTEECYPNIDNAADIGFDAIITQSTGPFSGLEAYANKAKSRGLKVFWYVHDPVWWRGGSAAGAYRDFATDCGADCPDNESLRRFIIERLSSIRETAGYYIADDTGIDPNKEAAAIREHNRAFKQGDPDAITMVGWAGVDANLFRPWLDSADALGHEYYPIHNGDEKGMLPDGTQTGWPTLNRGLAEWTYDNASIVQREADQAGVDSSFILQAFSWGWHSYDARGQGLCKATDSDLQCQQRYRYPTANELKTMYHNVLLASRPKVIAYWLLEDTSGWPVNKYSPAVLEPSEAEARQRKADLKAAFTAPLAKTEARLQETARQGNTITVDGSASRGLGGIRQYWWRENDKPWQQGGVSYQTEISAPTRIELRVVAYDESEAAAALDFNPELVKQDDQAESDTSPRAVIVSCGRRKGNRLCLSGQSSTGQGLRYRWDRNGNGRADAYQARVIVKRKGKVGLAVIDGQGRRSWAGYYFSKTKRR